LYYTCKEYKQQQGRVAGNKMRKFIRSLDKITETSTALKQIYKRDLQPGDVVLIFTRNSLYNLNVLENSRYLVSGGWFDRKLLSPLKTTIVGCTWGGSAIKVDIVAACGLRLEFGNRVITSPIEKILLIKNWQLN
jgi:hypothetical protein